MIDNRKYVPLSTITASIEHYVSIVKGTDNPNVINSATQIINNELNLREFLRDICSIDDLRIIYSKYDLEYDIEEEVVTNFINLVQKFLDGSVCKKTEE